jgi:hypothetical protein
MAVCIKVVNFLAKRLFTTRTEWASVCHKMDNTDEIWEKISKRVLEVIRAVTEDCQLVAIWLRSPVEIYQPFEKNTLFCFGYCSMKTYKKKGCTEKSI